MHNFNNKFQKSPSAGGSLSPTPLKPSILVTWSFVIWINYRFLSWLWRNLTS